MYPKPLYHKPYITLQPALDTQSYWTKLNLSRCEGSSQCAALIVKIKKNQIIQPKYSDKFLLI